MSGKVVNLRQVRKRLSREKDASAAAENRARFGRTKAECDLEESEADQARRLWQGHQIEKGTDELE